MIITKCYVSSFGILRDKTYTFVDGLNTIKAENGAGKTTLSVFIKSMFYGLNKSSKKNIDEQERKKYYPWNCSSGFGGYIEFKCRDKEFRIERFFGKKESDDRVKLIDLKTLTEYKDTENLGERLFGIDENGFLSTCFMSQNDFSNDDGSVISKFNDICETNNSKTYSNAMERLEKKYKDFKLNRGEGGILYEDQKKLYELNADIDKIKSVADVLNRLNGEVKEDETKRERLRSEIVRLGESLKEAGKSEAVKIKKARYNELTERNNRLSQRINELRQLTNNRLLSAEEYNDYSALYSEYITEKNNTVKKSDGKSNIYLWIVALLSAVISVLGLFFEKTVTYISLVFFVCFSVVGIMKTISLKKRKGPSGEKENRRENIEHMLFNLIESFGYSVENLDSFSAILNKIREVSKEYMETREEFLSNRAKIEEITKDGDVLKDGDSTLDFNYINRQIHDRQVEVDLTVAELARKKASIERYEELASGLNDLVEEKACITAKYNEDKEYFDILAKTIELLTKANENMKSKYRQPLEENLNKYLGEICNNKFTARIDTDLNIYVEDGGALREEGYYSEGIKNVLEICKRFALTEVLFTDEKPFIVLDDVFTNLDEKRLGESLESIKALSDSYQIIYFICHESRRV